MMNKNWSRSKWILNRNNIDGFSDEQLNKIWLEYLNKVILVFELVLTGDCDIESQAKIKEGLMLFAMHFQSLWC